ncbi:TetR/AcrR family transcriptional regulator [Frondihabitans australicus]|uniref:TetR family transcriptional regulator n=1 Tax=Frondihabitans australicus TaxID=386892 RepID=A0A495IJQ2_9MICO|nr:TetR family transcriptional regulator [Frondihabitans australicus]RKR75950.1 TetR family transcriptional regulator [Frondihabitans australicus]
MENDTARARALDETRTRILDVALDVLGANPDAGMADIAAAAGVVRRTVYGHFPNRAELVHTLAQRAVDEVAGVLAEVDQGAGAADTAWVDFIARLWPLAARYRVLVALRRGEFGADIHALLAPVDRSLAALVQRGQDAGVFARHLPPDVLSQIAYGVVFTVADTALAAGGRGAGGSDGAGAEAGADTAAGGARADLAAATTASLLVLGVPESRARELLGGRS